jgi:hypothetical protein
MAQNRRSLFEKNDIALYIAPLTAICYGMAYVYQYGKYKYYWIPIEFIELNLNNLTTTILSVFPLLIFVTIFYYRMIVKINTEEAIDSNNSNSRSKKIFPFIYFLLMAFFIYLSTRIYGYVMIVSVIIISIVITIGIIIGLVLYKKKKYFYTLLIGLFLSFIFSYVMGISSSALEKTYTIVKIEEKDFVLLETYKDKFILAAVNLETKEFSKELIIKDINDDYTVSTQITSFLKPEK